MQITHKMLQWMCAELLSREPNPSYYVKDSKGRLQRRIDWKRCARRKK